MPIPARALKRIEQLQLAPHPEGGYFHEFFRSSSEVMPADGRGARAALTAIHFLLRHGQHSRWHEVRSDEQWTFLEGDPLELFFLPAEGHEVRRVLLGEVGAGHTPSCIVPAAAWQAARPTGDFSLVTCTVGPGFDFADFRMLTEDAHAAGRIGELAPELSSLI